MAMVMNVDMDMPVRVKWHEIRRERSVAVSAWIALLCILVPRVLRCILVQHESRVSSKCQFV